MAAYQCNGHLNAALDEQYPPPKLIGRPEGDVRREMIYNACHDGGRQGGALAGAQRDEQLWRIEDDGVDARPLHSDVKIMLF